MHSNPLQIELSGIFFKGGGSFASITADSMYLRMILQKSGQIVRLLAGNIRIKTAFTFAVTQYVLKSYTVI